MNKDKKPIVVGRMKSGKFRYHIEDDVFDMGGAVQNIDSNRPQTYGVHFGGTQ